MTGTHLKRAAASLILLAAWTVVATQLVPPLISTAYDQRSLPILNRLILSRADHPLEEYLQYWRNIAWLGGIWCVAIWGIPPLIRRLATPGFFVRAVQPATPGALGLIRSWTCGVLLVMTLWEDLASTALLPRSMVRPKGILYLLHAVPGFEQFMANPWALWTFEHLTAFFLFLGVIGLGTRVVVPAGALCYLVMAGILREYAWFYHTGLLPIYALAVLSFTPCGDGWSVDRLIRISRNRPVPPHVSTPTYGWSRYAVWMVIAVPYVAAGLSKLYYGGGFAWVDADNMRWILLRTSLAMMEFDFGISERLVAQPDLIFVMLGCVGLLTELVFGLVLVSSWARLVLPGAMILVHLGILFLQNILFLDLILLLVVFYNLRPMTQAVGRWITRRRGRVTVWYDGSCGLCDRTVRMLSGLDLLRRLDVRDFRQEDLEAYAARSGISLDPKRLEDEMAVVVGGTCHWGFEGYRALAGALPLFWVTVPLLYLPGVAPLGEAAYQSVAQRRHGLCPLEQTAGSSVADAVTHRSGARAAVGIVFFLLSWWVTHIEFYPLTTMKMFSNPNPRPGVVSYVRAVAHYEDGGSTRADFDQWIGAMADSRYRMVIGDAFGTPEDRARCDEFLDATAKVGNARLEDGRRITSFELQLWEWNFSADTDPSFRGHVVDSYIYPVGKLDDTVGG